MDDNYHFVSVCQQWNRMCYANDTCSTCPIRNYAIDMNPNFIMDAFHCRQFVCEFPNECKELIIEWNKSNPQKTYLIDFFGKFPNAPRNSEDFDLPRPCPNDIYDGVAQLCIDDSIGNPACTCKKCWNQIMPEEE